MQELWTGSMSRPKLLVTEPIAEAGLAELRLAADVTVQLGLERAELLAAVADVEALVVRSYTRVDAELFAAAPHLRIVARAGIGTDNIDVDAATRAGVTVVNAPTSNVRAAAEHTIALLFALARRVPQHDRALRRGEWRHHGRLGIELTGRRLGIIGLGKVGTEVARRALGLGMEVVAHDPYIAPVHARNLGVGLLDRDELLATADVVTLHVPLTDDTRSMIDAAALARMKPTAFLINCARGPVVVVEAVQAALHAGTIAAAALDVFPQEPPPADLPLFACEENLVVTPHVGGSTQEALEAIATDVAGQIAAYFAGEPVRFPVNLPQLGPEALATLRPYLRLADVLGRLRTALGGLGERVVVGYHGRITALDTRPLRAATLVGLLAPVSEGTVNMVNAGLIADAHGLDVSEVSSERERDGYENTLSLEVPGGSPWTSLVGTVVGGAPRLVRLDGFRVDIPLAPGHLLIGRHRDRPGQIGRIGTLLGGAGINISFMQVGRREQAGEAMMVLGLDEAVPEPLRRQILAFDDVFDVRVVSL